MNSTTPTPQAKRAARRLSYRIAKDLFTDGSGKRAKRLLMLHGDDERPGAGWCQNAVADRIEAFITTGKAP
jgi:hypothetical protein